MRNGALKSVLDVLEQVFAELNIDYYLIGALARDVWYKRGNKPFRGTKDVDFAVLVGSLSEYDSVKDYLKNHHSYIGHKDNSFVLTTPEGIQVDILPFGAFEEDGKVTIGGEGMTSIKVNGFNEVLRQGTEHAELETGNAFKVATLSAIAMLKFIAFDDRPEVRQKDAGDIANMIIYFFDLNSELIYNSHNDLFGEDVDRTMESISSIVIGREIKKISAENSNLFRRIQEILLNHINEGEKSDFIRYMAIEVGKSIDEARSYIINIYEGLKDHDY